MEAEHEGDAAAPAGFTLSDSEDASTRAGAVDASPAVRS
jgi:hypothetical protein